MSSATVRSVFRSGETRGRVTGSGAPAARPDKMPSPACPESHHCPRHHPGLSLNVNVEDGEYGVPETLVILILLSSEFETNAACDGTRIL